MKVFLYYEDNENSELHKTLKITLPKSWKAGPTSKLLTQFVETYNSSANGETNQLTESDMHLSIIDGDDDELVDVPSDAVTQDVIADRANVFVRHGPSTTLGEVAQQQLDAKKAEQEYKETTVACTRFGCKKRFPKGGPYPENCCHHVAPPVFHETAKFWSCCPDKKAYDWNDFEAIPGCQTGVSCTDVKQKDQQQFMGGVELRAQAGETANLKSIDDFNKAQVSGSEAAPVLDQCQKVMADLGIEAELFQQVTDGMKKALPTDLTEAEVLEAVAAELGSKLKAAMKAIAVEQLRIK